jgi:hypothetical protein
VNFAEKKPLKPIVLCLVVIELEQPRTLLVMNSIQNDANIAMGLFLTKLDLKASIALTHVLLL